MKMGHIGPDTSLEEEKKFYPDIEFRQEVLNFLRSQPGYHAPQSLLEEALPKEFEKKLRMRGHELFPHFWSQTVHRSFLLFDFEVEREFALFRPQLFSQNVSVAKIVSEAKNVLFSEDYRTLLETLQGCSKFETVFHCLDRYVELV